MDEEYDGGHHGGSAVDDIFHHIYARANAANPDMLRLVAVLDAIKQTIVETLGVAAAGEGACKAPLSTYFAALMTALERGGLEHAGEILYLQSLVLPHIPASILRAKYDALSRLFSAALIAPSILKDGSTLRPLLSCLSDVLVSAEPSGEAWALPSVAQPFAAMLAFAVDARPKVRKVAQQAVVRIAQAHFAAKQKGCTALLAQGIVKMLGGSSQRDQAKVAQLLPLVRTVLPLLDMAAMTDVCDVLLGLPLLGMAKVTSLAYSTLCTLLESPKARLSIRFVSRLVHALLAVPPSPDNHVAAVEYSYALTAGVARLASMERMKAGVPPEVPLSFGHREILETSAAPLKATYEVVVPAVQALREFLQSARVAVHHACANSIAIVLASTIDAALIKQALTLGRGVLHELVSSVEQIMQYKYQPSWPVSLPIIALLYRILGVHSATVMDSATNSLVELRTSLQSAVLAAQNEDDDDHDVRDRRKHKRARRHADDSDNSDAEVSRGRDGLDVSAAGAVDAAGSVGKSGVFTSFKMCDTVLAAAIRAMGIHNFTSLVPLSTNPTAVISDDRAWIVPLLRDNGQFAPCPLAFFSTVILPAIQDLETAAEKFDAERLPKNAKALRTKAMQLWALLPNIMVAPPDFAEAFDVTFGQTLTRALSDTTHHDLPAIVARAFETVISRARAAAQLPELRLGAFEEDEEEEDVPEGLTVAGKQAQQRKRGHDDEDEDDSSDDDGASAGSDNMDGASTIFGAGGVSVHANGEQSQNPRHILIQNVVHPKDKLPVMTKATGEAVIATLRRFAKNILPVFFSGYENCVTGKINADGAVLSSNTVNERTRKLLDAVGLYLSIAPAEVLGGLGERLLKLLVQALGQQAAADEAVAEARRHSKSADSKSPAEIRAVAEATQIAAKVFSLLSLAQVLMPNLPDVKDPDDETTPTARFFKTLRPAIGDDAHPRSQKRAYTVLASLLLHHPAFTTKSTSRRDEIVHLLRDSLMTVAAAARRGRLVCLKHVVKSLDINDAGHMSLVPLLLGEVMLCTKDTNGKVRTASFALLAAMAHRMAEGGDGEGPAAWGELEAEDGDEGMGAPAAAGAMKVSLTEFFRMLLGGFAASTPHMRSAAVRAASRLIYEFSHRQVVHALLEPLLYAALELMKEKSQEVALAVVGFVKVCLSCMPPAELKDHVGEIITALMVWSGVTRNRIRAKVRAVLERLVRKFGYAAIEAHIPEADLKLIQHMKKLQQRREKKRMQFAASEEGAGPDGATAVTTNKTSFEDLLDEDDDELGSDDGADAASAVGSKFTAASARSWGIVGSRVGSTAGKNMSSRMSAVTAEARKMFKNVAAAPLPPVGSVIELDDKKKKSKSVLAKSQVTTAKTAVRGKSVASGAMESMLKADDDAPMDLMDSRAMRSVVGADPLTLAAINRQRRNAGQSGDGFLGAGVRLSADGKKIIVTEDDSGSDDSSGSEDSDARDIRMKKRVRDRKPATAGAGESTEAEGEKSSSSRGSGPKRSSGGGSESTMQGWGMKKGKSGPKAEKSNNFTGAQFKAKSAGGDRAKKGAKFEPFAYVPLDSKAVNDSGSRAFGRFGTVIASTSKSGRAATKRVEEKSVLGKRGR